MRGAGGVIAFAVAALAVPGIASAQATRFQVSVDDAFPRAGSVVNLQVVDVSGRGGVRAKVCLRPRNGGARCRRLRLRRGQSSAVVRLRPPRPGAWSVRVARRTLAELSVRPPGDQLRILATGDSMMWRPAEALTERLAGRAKVLLANRNGTALTKPGSDWPSFAQEQAARVQPDVTFVVMGALEGFPLATRDGRTVYCCGRRWSKLYSRIVQGVMRGYSRAGAGWVYWLTLPMARDQDRVDIFRGVNTGVRIASVEARSYAQMVDLEPVLSPGGVFTDSVSWQGEFYENIRESDGVHLEPAGGRLAAVLMEQALVADGLLP